MENANRVVNRPAPYSSLMPEARQHDTFGNQGGLGERDSMILLDDDDDDFDLPVEALVIDDDDLIFTILVGDMYQIIVDNKHGEKSEFVKLLKEIDCESRFVACSVDYSDMFFAELNKSEAAKLKGVHGIKDVVQFTYVFTHW